MSTSPRLSAASRVDSSGITRNTRRFTRRRLAPVLLEGLQHQLHARREGDELVGAGADRRLLEALVADLLHVLLRHDPAGAGGVGVEGQEVGPGLLEPEAHVLRVRRLDRGHLLLQQLLRGAAIALERELHVLRGDRLAVVEQRALAQHELVDQPVLRDRPGLGQAAAPAAGPASASPARRAARRGPCTA